MIKIGKSKKACDRPNHAMRLVCIKCSPHTSRGRYNGTSTGPSSDGVLRIATNLLDVPAEMIGLIYSQRWAIEIQCYSAIIACMLINLWTGRKPTKRTPRVNSGRSSDALTCQPLALLFHCRPLGGLSIQE